MSPTNSTDPGDFSTLTPWDGRTSHAAGIFAIITAILCVIVVGLRLYVRLTMTKVGPDDIMILPATALMLVNTALTIALDWVDGGIERPLWTVPNDLFTFWFKILLVTQFLYPATMSCIRLSVLLFYRRIMAGADYPILRILVYVLMGFMGVYIVVFEFLTGFMCHPVHDFWIPSKRNAACGDIYYYNLNLALYATSLPMDLLIIILPFPIVWNLKLPRNQKLGTLGMLLLGASASVGVAYRLTAWVIEGSRFHDIDPRWAANPLSLFIPPQFDKHAYTIFIPAQVEMTLSIIGASLPAIKPLLVKAKLLVSSISSTHRSRTGGNLSGSGALNGALKGHSVSTNKTIGSKTMGMFRRDENASNESMEMLNVGGDRKYGSSGGVCEANPEAPSDHSRGGIRLTSTVSVHSTRVEQMA